MSTHSFSSKQVRLDCLGTKSILLIVQGGKPINSSRQTKPFKIIYPCRTNAKLWQSDKYVYTHEGIDYEETPWMQLHQDILSDYISAPSKSFLTFSSLRSSTDLNSSFAVVGVSTLLLLHNRRKTEALLHNMRYIIANAMAKYANIGKILPSFADFNYTYFDGLIKTGIGSCYLDYYKSITEWSKNNDSTAEGFKISPVKHPYIKGLDIVGMDMMVSVIYGTYMMSKAPTKQSVEQTNNLQSVLEPHINLDYKSDIFETGHEYDANIATDRGKLYNDDLGYDPEYSFVCGKMLAARLSQKVGSREVDIKWNNIMSSPIDLMANNSGLRGVEKDDFFGKKGYYVIYKELLKGGNLAKIEEILASDLTDKQVYDRIMELNQVFYKEQSARPLTQVIFHIVDKKQRGGGREIYVMDYLTKLYQYPLETFLMFLSKMIDEEIISVPSTQRSKLIHGKLFERKTSKDVVWYLSLDCRRWAPMCNPSKYVFFVLGAKNILPDSFVSYVLHFFNLYTKKQIHTRKAIYNQLMSNPQNKKYAKFFEVDEDKDSAHFVLPYSFVMGIFNLLSSLMHAASLILIKQYSLLEYAKINVNVDFSIVSHSDDSGGTVTIPENSPISPHLKTLAMFQKMGNHMYSDKKCSVGLIYFELLSILYVMRGLMPMIPKFVQGVSLIASGKGPASDLKIPISKCIELMNNGATMEQAYILLIVLSNMYRNFYNLPNLDLPPSVMGMPNCHPAMYLAYGASADEFRVMRYDITTFRKSYNFLSSTKDSDIEDGLPTISFRSPSRVPAMFNDFDAIKLPDLGLIDKEWFFRQLHTNNSVYNLYWFKTMLKSRDFQVSILNINEIRRLCDGLFFISGGCIHYGGQLITIGDVASLIVDAPNTKVIFEDLLNAQFSSLNGLLDWLDSLPVPNFAEKTEKTIKPCQLSFTGFSDFPLSKFSPMELAVDICNPELRKYLLSRRIPGAEIQLAKEYIESLGLPLVLHIVKDFLEYCSKALSKSVFFYSTLASGKTLQFNESGLFTIIRLNHSTLYEIKDTSGKYIAPKFDYQMLGIDISNESKRYVTACRLSRIIEREKNPLLANLVLIDELGGTPISNIASFKPKTEMSMLIKNFFDLAKHGSNISLQNVSPWALWYKKQIRVGDGWTGPGSLLISLSIGQLQFSIMSKKITGIVTSISDQVVCSDIDNFFITTLMKNLEYEWLQPISSISNQLCFGINKQNVLGVWPVCEILQMCSTLDFAQDIMPFQFASKTIYTHEFGKHLIGISGVKYTLETLDTVIADSQGLCDFEEIFDISRMDSVELQHLQKCIVTYDSRFFKTHELDSEHFLQHVDASQTYSMAYRALQDNTTLSALFMQEITHKMTEQKDIVQQALEVFGVDQALSMIPLQHVEQVKRFLYYQTDHTPGLRNALKGLNENQVKAEIIKLCTEVKINNWQIEKINTIGEFENFSKFSVNYLFGTDFYRSLFDDLGGFVSEVTYDFDAGIVSNLLAGLMNINKSNPNYSKLASAFHFGVYEHLSGRSEYKTEGVNIGMIAFFRVLKLIFSDMGRLALFDRHCENHVFWSLFPRKPDYIRHWQILVKKLHYHYMSTIDPDVEVPDKSRQVNSILKAVKKDLKDRSVVLNSKTTINKTKTKQVNVEVLQSFDIKFAADFCEPIYPLICMFNKISGDVDLNRELYPAAYCLYYDANVQNCMMSEQRFMLECCIEEEGDFKNYRPREKIITRNKENNTMHTLTHLSIKVAFSYCDTIKAANYIIENDTAGDNALLTPVFIPNIFQHHNVYIVESMMVLGRNLGKMFLYTHTDIVIPKKLLSSSWNGSMMSDKKYSNLSEEVSDYSYFDTDGTNFKNSVVIDLMGHFAKYVNFEELIVQGFDMAKLFNDFKLRDESLLKQNLSQNEVIEFDEAKLTKLLVNTSRVSDITMFELLAGVKKRRNWLEIVQFIRSKTHRTVKNFNLNDYLNDSITNVVEKLLLDELISSDIQFEKTKQAVKLLSASSTDKDKIRLKFISLVESQYAPLEIESLINMNCTELMMGNVVMPSLVIEGLRDAIKSKRVLASMRKNTNAVATCVVLESLLAHVIVGEFNSNGFKFSPSILTALPQLEREGSEQGMPPPRSLNILFKRK
jgi:hypothetical protein